MKKLLVFLPALALLASAAPARANIDFTLNSKQTASPDALNSGSKYITDGDSHIYLRVPMTWKASSSAARLDLIPDQADSRVQISQVGGVQTLPLDAAGLANLRNTAAGSIPSGAKDVKVVSEASDLLPIFGWKSYEIVHEYSFFGQQMRRSMLYINMIPGRVILVTVTAVAADFDNVHEQMRKMMYGWFEPSRDLNPEEARKYEAGEYRGG